MKLSKIIAALIAATALGILYGGDFWAEKPYTEWTEKEVFKLLGDSPWADFRSFQREGPIMPQGSGRSSGQPNIQSGGSGEGNVRGVSEPAREYVVRFWSAAPIRMAWGQLALLRGASSAEEVQQYIENVPFDGKIIVGLLAAPQSENQKLEEMSLESFGEDTFIELKSHKKKLYPVEYIKPSQFGTGAVLVFPREIDGKAIDWSKEKEIRFRCEVDNKTRLNEKFKINKMEFQGKIEL